MDALLCFRRQLLCHRKRAQVAAHAFGATLAFYGWDYFCQLQDINLGNIYSVWWGKLISSPHYMKPSSLTP